MVDDACKRFCGHAVQREGDVDDAEREEDRIASLLDLGDVELGDAQHGCHLLPSQASVSHEDDHAEDVEVSPEVVGAVEEAVLKIVDIADWNCGDICVWGPEEIEFGDSIPCNAIHARLFQQEP